jgi:hypothetical protein
VEGRRGALLDVALYGGSSLVAGGIALFDSIPVHREWGRLAIGPYAVGAAVATVLAARRAGPRARVCVAVLVTVGSALLPLSLEIAWRARTEPGRHVHAEAIVTEEAAKALLDGRDPYATDYLNGPLSARPLGTKTHFPYLPGMLLFGIPRAIAGDHAPLADARVMFAAGMLGATALALRMWRAPPGARLLAFQLLVTLPTGALFLATGGDDLPVLAAILLCLVLADRGRLGWAGVTAGAAVAMKQIAWPLLPFLILSGRDRARRSGRARALAGASAVALPVILPFFLWGPTAFVEDVIRFPLGLGQQPSAAETPTLGSFLVRTLPLARGWVVTMLVGLVLAAGAYLLFARPRRGPSDVALHTGLSLALALLLAPAARLGYVVYPVELFVWARLLRQSAGPSRERAESTMGLAPARRDP